MDYANHRPFSSGGFTEDLLIRWMQMGLCGLAVKCVVESLPMAQAGRNSFTFPVDDGPVEIIYEASGGNYVITIGPSRADFRVRTFGDGQVRIIRL